MPSNRRWVCIELTKDNPDERGKNAAMISEVLEEDIETLTLDVDGVVYNVNVKGIGVTHQDALNNLDARYNDQRKAEA